MNFITSLHSSRHNWTTDRKHKWTLSHHFIAHTAQGPATGPAIGQQTENTSELYHITSYLTRHTALPLDNRQKTQVNFITSLHSSHGTGPCHWTTDRKHKWTLSHHFIAHTAQGPATGQQTENTSELYHITSYLTRHRALPLDNRQKTQVNFITSLHSSHGTGPCHWTTDRKHKWTLSHHFIAHTAQGPATGQQTENTSELYHITS